MHETLNKRLKHMIYDGMMNAFNKELQEVLVQE